MSIPNEVRRVWDRPTDAHKIYHGPSLTIEPPQGEHHAFESILTN